MATIDAIRVEINLALVILSSVDDRVVQEVVACRIGVVARTGVRPQSYSKRLQRDGIINWFARGNRDNAS